MRKLSIIVYFAFLSIHSFCQNLTSGEYDSGMKIAYDSSTNKITGYFENYTGMDEETGNPKFSCVFYIIGTVKDSKVNVTTYYPNSNDDQIVGIIEIKNDSTFKIKLPEEHGGCWNVYHFADEKVTFKLEQQIPWIQIRYIVSEKAHFYSEKSIDKKQNSYVIKDDLVCIDTIDGEWAHCTFYGSTITTGWIRMEDLNK